MRLFGKVELKDMKKSGKIMWEKQRKWQSSNAGYPTKFNAVVTLFSLIFKSGEGAKLCIN